MSGNVCFLPWHKEAVHTVSVCYCECEFSREGRLGKVRAAGGCSHVSARITQLQKDLQQRIRACSGYLAVLQYVAFCDLVLYILYMKCEILTY